MWCKFSLLHFHADVGIPRVMQMECMGTEFRIFQVFVDGTINIEMWKVKIVAWACTEIFHVALHIIWGPRQHSG